MIKGTWYKWSCSRPALFVDSILTLWCSISRGDNRSRRARAVEVAFKGDDRRRFQAAKPRRVPAWTRFPLARLHDLRCKAVRSLQREDGPAVTGYDGFIPR